MKSLLFLGFLVLLAVAEIQSALPGVRIQIVTGSPSSPVAQQMGVSYTTNMQLIANPSVMQPAPSTFSTASKCMTAQWSTSSNTVEVAVSTERIQSGQGTDLTPLELHGVTQDGLSAKINAPQQGDDLTGTPFYASVADCNSASSSDPAITFEVLNN